MSESKLFQIGSDWNFTLVKLLVMVVFFTGVFQTTCVTEEAVEVMVTRHVSNV